MGLMDNMGELYLEKFRLLYKIDKRNNYRILYLNKY
jgi:hypothetical protein